MISRHEDIKAISKNNDVWSTYAKGAVMRLPVGTTREQLELTKALLINHDAPAHNRLHKLVSRLFTARAVAPLEEKLAAAAHEIDGSAAEGATGNFVDDVAMRLPLQAIADLIGVPEADRERLYHWTNSIMNTDDRDFDDDPLAANAELMGYADTMAEERRRRPTDYIVTRLIEADVDGDGLDDPEFAFFVILLAVAGSETTRNAMTHGMNAFFDNRDQWELFKRERPETAIDEIIRWATPVHCFSEPRWWTPRSAVSISARVSGPGCSTARPTTTNRCSSAPSDSISVETLTPTWRSVATAHTTASAPTWPAWRSS